MKHLKSIFLTVALASLLACGSYPTANVSQGGDRPAIVFNTANKNAQVILDGIVIGKAYEYRGKPHSLIVEEGAHTLQITDNDQILLEEKFFVSVGQTRTIDIDR